MEQKPKILEFLAKEANKLEKAGKSVAACIPYCDNLGTIQVGKDMKYYSMADNKLKEISQKDFCAGLPESVKKESHELYKYIRCCMDSKGQIKK